LDELSCAVTNGAAAKIVPTARTTSRYCLIMDPSFQNDLSTSMNGIMNRKLREKTGF
jgi:hypothetical protein